ncbi:RsfA family transcriptional regulator [Bacillus sp. FJAT-45066]|uniref:RsfA family transcriptional regulator n=1 Tax=Bacillus sp. FJAT-45066 TaxID=2011010 RepID=UPI000BB93DC3|nr:RsfA family transcriptional regulator [Bacillus sp. FJAT-45066]
MKERQDAWSEENDLMLAETVLRHVREGSTQLNAFEEVGDKLNRTSAACGFRWNAVVRHDYEKALQLAKKQRKQRQRALGQPTKKLLYTPPETSIEDTIPFVLEQDSKPSFATKSEMVEFGQEQELVSNTRTEKTATSAQVNNYVPATGSYSTQYRATNVANPTGLTMEAVIHFLQSMKRSNVQNTALQSENARLAKENEEYARQISELEKRVQKLQDEQTTIQEDYETLMKIMNRARKLVLFDEEDRTPSKFMMDRNGNLEKLAE